MVSSTEIKRRGLGCVPARLFKTPSLEKLNGKSASIEENIELGFGKFSMPLNKNQNTVFLPTVTQNKNLHDVQTEKSIYIGHIISKIERQEDLPVVSPNEIKQYL